MLASKRVEDFMWKQEPVGVQVLEDVSPFFALSHRFDVARRFGSICDATEHKEETK